MRGRIDFAIPGRSIGASVMRIPSARVRSPDRKRMLLRHWSPGSSQSPIVSPRAIIICGSEASPLSQRIPRSVPEMPNLSTVSLGLVGPVSNSTVVVRPRRTGMYPFPPSAHGVAGADVGAPRDPERDPDPPAVPPAGGHGSHGAAVATGARRVRAPAAREAAVTAVIGRRTPWGRAVRRRSGLRATGFSRRHDRDGEGLLTATVVGTPDIRCGDTGGRG